MTTPELIAIPLACCVMVLMAWLFQPEHEACSPEERDGL